MQIFSTIEEYLPNSVKALLLGTAIFGSSANTAQGWQELSTPELPAATAHDSAGKTKISEHVFEIRNQGELKDVWSVSQKVYAEVSILNNSVLRGELNSLQRSLAQDSSDWTVVVVAPQILSPKGIFKSSKKEDLDKRAEEIHTNLRSLARFSKDENLLLIELTPDKTNDVRAAYLPSVTFSEFGPSKAQWKASIGNEFVESIKGGTPLSEIVLSTINNAVIQRETRAAINQQEQHAALTKAIARFPKVRDEMIDLMTQSEKSIKPELKESVHSGFEVKRAEVVKYLDATELAFREKSLVRANRELERAKQLVAELDATIGELGNGLESITSLRQYINTTRDYSFLDEPGRDALAEAAVKADQLEHELYTLISGGNAVAGAVAEQLRQTDAIVSQDLNNEHVAIAISLPLIGITGLLTLGCSIEVVSKLRTSIFQGWQEAADKRKTFRDRLASTEKLLDTIDLALKVKRDFMRGTMVPEALNFDTNIDEQSDTGNQLRSAAVQGWRVLNKLEEITKNARQLLALGDIESLDLAQALVGSAPVAVDDNDSLGFIRDISEWNEKAALEDPKSYRPPTVTFNQLHEEFVRLAQICKGLLT